MALLLLASLVLQNADALVERLRSDRIEERDEATRRLRAMGKAAAPEIGKASNDVDPEVAVRARRLLRLLELDETAPASLKKALPGFVDRLAEYDTAWTRAFLECVRKEGIRDALDFLAPGALRGARTPRELEEICDWIAEEALQSALPELLRLIRSDNETVAGQAMTAASRLDRAKTVPHVLPLLHQAENREVRLLALQALIWLRAAETVGEISRLAGDEDVEVRRTAAHALAHLGTRKAIPELVRFLKDDAQEVRFQAVVSLDLLRAYEAVPDLIRHLAAEKDGAVRKEVVYALSHWGGAEARPEFLRLLADPADRVRSAAARALGNADDRASTAALRALLADPHEGVANAAAWSLCRLGAREGVPRWLEASRRFAHPLGALNAVRSPAEWRRLREKAERIDPKKPGSDLGQHLRGALGLRVDLSAIPDLTEDKFWECVLLWAGVQPRPVGILEALESLRKDDHLEFILEADRVRVFPEDKAVKFWADWWAAEAARKR